MAKRHARSARTMKLPVSLTPRPGDEVVWYADSKRASGKYVGHGTKGCPVVLSAFNNQSRLSSFDCVRLSSHDRRTGPNWLRLPKSALIKPLSEEEDRFDELLSQRIPPGPTYLELIEEIWSRGYEIYVVGGTVRDVVSGDKSNDVDLVTTMPIKRYESFFRAMFKNMISISDENGYIRLGGKGQSGDPFIDLKVFCHQDTGTPDALFGTEFDKDVELRDFSCNAIYYDPINRALIDPTLRGVSDAGTRTLGVICNYKLKSPTALGQIAIRCFKFIMRGYKLDTESIVKFQAHFVPNLASLTNSARLSYLQRQIFGKLPTDEHARAIAELEEAVHSTGNRKLWVSLFQPITQQLKFR